MRITYSASATGAGSGPDAGALKFFLEGVPDQAKTNVSTYSGDIREGSTWTLSATWSDTQHHAWIGQREGGAA